MMGKPAYELIVSLVAVVGILAGYLYLAQGTPFPPSSLVGHGLGIVGFVLMLCTETLYSLRKRTSFHFGRMSLWLQLHIVTGIVGPLLVVLHAGWKFNGLAGILTVVTVVVVVSGLVGRYIYTAVPRTLDGAEVAAADLERQIAGVDCEVERLGLDAQGATVLAVATAVPRSGWALALGGPFMRWRLRRHLRRAVRELGPAARAHGGPLWKLLTERQRLQMQIHSLDAARRLFALWHVFHIPLTGVLFTLAFIHIAAALYYATLLK
jgi:hypothetical protein